MERRLGRSHLGAAEPAGATDYQDPRQAGAHRRLPAAARSVQRLAEPRRGDAAYAPTTDVVYAAASDVPAARRGAARDPGGVQAHDAALQRSLEGGDDAVSGGLPRPDRRGAWHGVRRARRHLYGA